MAVEWAVAKPIKTITPEDRVEKWKKLWATPRLLDDVAAEAAYDEFVDALVPRNMHKLFLKSFGKPKAEFGNRFFKDDALYHNWDTKLSALVGVEGGHVEATVIYSSPDKLEAHALRGERRRSLRDIVIDGWYCTCAVVRSERVTLYVFIEPRMRGCIVRAVKIDGVDDEVEEG